MSEVQPIIIAHNQRNNCIGGDENYKNIETYCNNTIAKCHVHFFSQMENDFIISQNRSEKSSDQLGYIYCRNGVIEYLQVEYEKIIRRQEDSVLKNTILNDNIFM